MKTKKDGGRLLLKTGSDHRAHICSLSQMGLAPFPILTNFQLSVGICQWVWYDDRQWSAHWERHKNIFANNRDNVDKTRWICFGGFWWPWGYVTHFSLNQTATLNRGPLRSNDDLSDRPICKCALPSDAGLLSVATLYYTLALLCCRMSRSK